MWLGPRQNIIMSLGLEGVCNDVATPEQRLSLHTYRSLQLRHVEVGHVQVSGSEVGSHMHALVQCEAHLAAHHGQQAAEVAFPKGGSGPLFLGFLGFWNSGRLWDSRNLWLQGGPASIGGKASAPAIRAPGEAEHRHRNGQWSLHSPGTRFLPADRQPWTDKHPDLLTCGRCRQTFPLEAITAFMDHKKLGCQLLRDPSPCQGSGESGRDAVPLWS